VLDAFAVPADEAQSLDPDCDVTLDELLADDPV
jgi:hypothetical protein